MKRLTIAPSCGKCEREGTHFYIVIQSGSHHNVYFDWFCADHYLAMVKENLSWGKFLTANCGVQYTRTE